MCDKHFEGINPNMKIEQTTTSDKVSAVASKDGLEAHLLECAVILLRYLMAQTKVQAKYMKEEPEETNEIMNMKIARGRINEFLEKNGL